MTSLSQEHPGVPPLDLAANIVVPQWLMMKKELDVLPLEDGKLHVAAIPIKDVRVVSDREKIKVRRDAIVLNCLAQKGLPFSDAPSCPART